MTRRPFLLLFPLALFRQFMRADAAQGDPRLARLFGHFIAPCCWRESLLTHQSPKADELRAEIRQRIAEGWPDSKIEASLVEQHSRRILSQPDGNHGAWLSAMPWVALLAGGGWITWFIRKSVAASEKAALLSVMLLMAANAAEWRTADPPALPGSGMPFLAQAPDGSVLLSWIDPGPEQTSALRYSRWNGTSWSAPETIAQGNRWFVNWADFPAMHPLANGTLLAHWLARPDNGGRYGYGIRVAHRNATGSWRESAGMNLRNLQDYAGFLSFAGSAAAYLAPPADAAPAQHGHDGHDGEGHRKTLRFARFDKDGAIASDVELDSDVCSCCQTSTIDTGAGLLVAYRDHLPGEIRDISYVRLHNGKWSEPRPVHRDGWQINGCPTEGPSLAVSGNQVGIAWMTRAGGQSRLQFSIAPRDGEFAAPKRVDDGSPLGRPSLIANGTGGFLLTWLERVGDAAEIRLKTIPLKGSPAPPVTVAKVAASRDTGLPKIAIRQDRVLVVWREGRVRAAWKQVQP